MMAIYMEYHDSICLRTFDVEKKKIHRNCYIQVYEEGKQKTAEA